MLYYNIFFSLFLVFFLSGCSYDYYIKDEGIVYKQRKLFKQLCEAEDRSVIYKTVEVDGYLSASRSGNSCRRGGWLPIVKDGYSYYECTTTPVKGHTLPPFADIYRFTIEQEGNNLCQNSNGYYSYYQHDSEEKLGKFGNVAYFIKDYKDQLQGKCLVVQKVDRPKSQYMYLSTLSYYDEHEKMFYDELKKKYPYESESKKGLISSGERHYFDMQTGDILAKVSNYTFHPKSRRFSFSSSVKCKEKKRINPSEIFIPNNKQK